MEGYIGEIRMFGGNFPPRNWAFCDGQLLAIASNTALFSVIGTYYGGDGRTTFGVPDLRGRTAIGIGSGPGLSPVQEGQKGGREEVTLTEQNLPNHSHVLSVSNASGTDSNPSNNYPAVSEVQIERGGDKIGVNTYGSSPNANMSPNAIGHTGGNIPFGIRNPFMGLHYIICVNGIYPSRS
ncbi:phage tail protein [Echinicola salinicaeni]|uniref:phage tail protein n=1 Tax=Echinicola salinicaeni TaxID=2762757 RepID=UPI00164805A6|nr:tail fiber protein [Echinicola salinicaeni]